MLAEILHHPEQNSYETIKNKLRARESDEEAQVLGKGLSHRASPRSKNKFSKNSRILEIFEFYV